MPYFVKTNGPVVAKRGPYETVEEANSAREGLALDALYQGQNIFVEFETGVPFTPPRTRLFRPPRPKRRPGRSGTRGSKRSPSGGGGGFGTGTRKRRRKRTFKRSSKRR